MASFCSSTTHRPLSCSYAGGEKRLLSPKSCRICQIPTAPVFSSSVATTSYHEWRYGLASSRAGTDWIPCRKKEQSWVVRMEGRSSSSASSSSRTETRKKIAKLYVEKQQTVPLPTFVDGSGNPQHLSVFLGEPEGKQCMLNTKALRKYEVVDDTGVFRCYLPKIEFLNFEVAPVLDLLVASDEEGCRVDLLSCKFEGSDDLVQGQNERFSASMRNHLSWSSEQVLQVRLELDVALEVYTLPFTLLPISAVESPGTLILQVLVDRLVPLFLEQLFIDYRAWAEGRVSGVDGNGRAILVGKELEKEGIEEPQR